jgi:2-polyprenyl-3-methyl-5-hydroxy-6-metoxy-1,4-benzoquinol methylase
LLQVEECLIYFIFGAMSAKDWFASWFDTSYYHTLYHKRDDKEAKKFITRLVAQLDIPENSDVLDLACGKGRHSRTLGSLGMNVLGVDLSPKSIKSALKRECENVHFMVHDMREVIPSKRFDAIFNLFTSFGYFENDAENEKVLECIHQMLQPNGHFVFDYLNLEPTIEKLVESERKEINGIQFDIKRQFDGKFVRKAIDVEDQGVSMHFEEKVRGFRFEEIIEMMQKNGLIAEKIFGDFELNPYDEHTSDRMILICKKRSR